MGTESSPENCTKERSDVKDFITAAVKNDKF